MQPGQKSDTEGRDTEGRAPQLSGHLATSVPREAAGSQVTTAAFDDQGNLIFAGGGRGGVRFLPTLC